MAISSLAGYDSLLNQCYNGPKLLNLAMKDNPLFALLPKDTTVGGNAWKVRVQGSNGQGVSNDITQAIANGALTGPDAKAFLLTYKTKYAVADIDNLTIESSMGDKNAVVDALTNGIEGAMEELGKQIEVSLFGDGFGALSVIGSVSGSTVTLPAARAQDMEKIEVGQQHVFAQFGTTGNVRSSTALTVTGVDRDNYIITYSATLASVGGVAGDSIFIKGNRQESGSPSAVDWMGLQGWLPITAPTAGDNFFGVDRSTDVDRYAGVRIVGGAGVSTRETLIVAAMRAGRRGARTSHIFCDWERYGALQQEMGTYVVYNDIKAGADIVFRGIEVNMPGKGGGAVTVVPAWACPANYAFGLDLSTWKLGSVNGDVIRNPLRNGKLQDYVTKDAIQLRYRAYGNLACFGPGRNWVCQFN